MTPTEKRRAFGFDAVSLEDIKARVMVFTGHKSVIVEFHNDTLIVVESHKELIAPLADTTVDWPAEYREESSTLLSLGFFKPEWSSVPILYEYVGRLKNIGLGSYEWGIKIEELMSHHLEVAA